MVLFCERLLIQEIELMSLTKNGQAGNGLQLENRIFRVLSAVVW